MTAVYAGISMDQDRRGTISGLRPMKLICRICGMLDQSDNTNFGGFGGRAAGSRTVSIQARGGSEVDTGEVEASG
jgi:hypothetical protein